MTCDDCLNLDDLDEGDVVRFFATDTAPLVTGTVGTFRGRRVVWASGYSALTAATAAYQAGAPYPFRPMFITERVCSEVAS